MRSVLSVLCYVAAGFFVYTVTLLAFVNELPASRKSAIMAVFSVPVAVFFVGARWALPSADWRRELGIVLLSGAAVTSLVAISFLCLLMTPELQPQLPLEKLHFFGDYIAGVGCIALVSIAGFLCLRTAS